MGKGQLILIAALGGVLVLGWLFAAFGSGVHSTIGWSLHALTLGVGVVLVFRGLLLGLGRAQPDANLGYSALGSFLMGVGLTLSGRDEVFQGVLAHVVDVAGTVAFLAGLVIEARVRPPREPDVIKRDL